MAVQRTGRQTPTHHPLNTIEAEVTAKGIQLYPELDPEGQEFQRRLAGAMITRTNLAITRVLDQALKPLGITFARQQVLSAVYFAEAPGIPLGRIAEKLIVHPTTITGAIERLVKDGYVVRHQLPEDRRTHYATLTPAGEDLYRRAAKSLDEVSYGMPELSLKQLKQLNSVLNAAIDGTLNALEPVDDVR